MRFVTVQVLHSVPNKISIANDRIRVFGRAQGLVWKSGLQILFYGHRTYKVAR